MTYLFFCPGTHPVKALLDSENLGQSLLRVNWYEADVWQLKSFEPGTCSGQEIRHTALCSVEKHCIQTEAVRKRVKADISTHCELNSKTYDVPSHSINSLSSKS